jgi:toluene monooxygenase system protein B
MALFPLTSNFVGDFVLQLVAVDDGDTMDDVAEKCAEHSVGRRVPAQDGVLRIRVQGADSPIDRSLTVAAAGLGPMECVEVYYE